jgi:hypothetical protein
VVLLIDRQLPAGIDTSRWPIACLTYRGRGVRHEWLAQRTGRTGGILRYPQAQAVQDSQLRPWQLIVTALLLVLMLIGLLLALARWIGA